MKILLVHCSYINKGGEDTVVANEIRLLNSNGIETIFFNTDNRSNKVIKLLLFPWNHAQNKSIIRLIERENPQLVHIHNLHFGISPSILWAIQRKGIPIIFTVHNFRLLCPSGTLYYNGKTHLENTTRKLPLNIVFSRPYRNSFILTLYFLLIYRMHNYIGTWHHVNKFLFLNSNSKHIFKNSILKARPNAFAIKPNFAFKQDLSEDNREDYFVYAGRLTKEKGFDEILEYFAKSNLMLHVFGEGVLFNEKKYPNILLHGLQDTATVYRYVSKSAALVFNSKCLEGLPMTIVEAFSLGIPVLCRANVSLDDYIKHDFNAIVFGTQDIPDIDSAFRTWQTMTPENRHQMSINARNTFVSHFTKEKSFSILQQIYHDAISS
jgi:glycosyltransferase involved in cell wall biosynthesis